MTWSGSVTTFFGGQLRHILLHGGRLDVPLVASLAVWLFVCGVVARWILFRRRFGPLFHRDARVTAGSGAPRAARPARALAPSRSAIDSERTDTA